MNDRNVLISEYRSLRSEIMKRQDSRILLVGVSVTGIGALLGIILKDNSEFLSNNTYSVFILGFFILLIIIIVLLLTIQQTKQIDMLFKNLKMTEILASYLVLYTDEMSETEVKTRSYLAFYYILIAVLCIFINIIFDVMMPFWIVLLIMLIIVFILASILSKTEIHGNEFYIKYLVDALLNDEDPNIRIRAAKALGNVKNNEEVVEPLINSLADEEDVFEDNAYKEYRVCEAAKISLIKIGKITVDSLIKTLNHDNKRLIVRLEEILGEIGDSRAVKPLSELLDDENYRIRMAAAASLGNIGDKTSAKYLIKFLNDTNDNVVAKTVESLGKIGVEDSKVINQLNNTLKHPSEFVRVSVYKTLGDLANDRSVTPIQKALGKEDNFNTIKEGLISLYKIGTENSINSLKLIHDARIGHSESNYANELIKRIERRKS